MNNITNDRPFIRGSVAIDSMRDNGYKNAAYALAELIDNSIQAGAKRVELMCCEHVESTGQRKTQRVKKIGIFDSGKGMNKETLHLALEFGASKHREDQDGMGKFGMGLPNSSISQCKRVEVWSWEKGCRPIYTYLDINELKKGELEQIPYPKYALLPTEIVKNFDDGKIPESGTFILWSNLDRLQWKTSTSIYKHSENLVGRMYRNFIKENKVKIVFKPLLWNEVKEEYFIPTKPEVSDFKANDPLYLTADSSLPDLPGNSVGEVPFETLVKDHVTITHKGESYKVDLTLTKIKSTVLEDIRKDYEGKQTLGNTIWGKHMILNSGVSVVRAGRELETRTDFFANDFLKEKARFMGVEVSFPPGLDEVFGVLNNKQAAVNFYNAKIDQESLKAGFIHVDDYEADLAENDDPKLKIYDVVSRLNKLLSKHIPIVNSINVTPKSKLAGESEGVSSEENPIRKFIEGGVGKRIETGSASQNKTPLTPAGKTGMKTGLTGKLPDEEIDRIIERFDKLSINTCHIHTTPDVFFDVTTTEGRSLLQINDNHSFFNEFYKLATKQQRTLLEVCLAAWAQMENEERTDQHRRKYEYARSRWGRVLQDFLDQDLYDEDEEV
ncbi:hypothetical protein BCS98_02570 [Vibrio breoganii]|uniref:ATP-binding protein n=1 Tax=Vibrio breoganii TaxID=553239 RepID=UPI000C843E32|nr:ATP-binding protein [Vibrio breoganii]PML61742.1 hypothetical protein BCT73_01385 [Vibrio breoganii]PMO77412.1 hypothetical protein BCT00_01385 [Vibrio breoganii]PMO89318.1 hypothetical protein BCS98_02570 [Vibrio breoganii]